MFPLRAAFVTAVLSAISPFTDAAPNAASKKCTSVPSIYPFFLGAYQDGDRIFGESASFQATTTTSEQYGIAFNYPRHNVPYATTFNITKGNMVSRYNDLQSQPYLSDPLASNYYLTFSPYNKTAANVHGQLGLREYSDVKGCYVTVNDNVVPWYLCEDQDAAHGQLFVVYEAPADRFCITIDLVAISEGQG